MEDTMRPTTRTALIALAIGATLLAQPRAQAEVRLFEDTPSVEQLRAILIPESHGGMTRRIEFPRHDALDAAKPVQPAAASGPIAQSRTDAAPTSGTSAPADAPAPVAAPAAKAAEAKAAPAADTAAAVGFRINFAFNSAVIPPAHFSQLDRIAELLHQEPALSLAVEGHTDAVGSADYNIELSRHRAEAVVRYLTEHGVDAGHLMAVGKGKTEPLVANPTDGRNRRVQFLRLSPDRTS
jgi:OmpA-OmpF porin, OOP family